MAEITNFKVKNSGAKALMKSPEVRAILIEEANRIKEAAESMSVSGNSKYGVATWDGKVSVHAVVYTRSLAAKRANAPTKTSKPLERAIKEWRG